MSVSGCAIHVALLSPPFSLLTYAAPAYLPEAAFFAGQRVAVPLGKGLRIGVVTWCGKETPDQSASGGGFVVKPALWALDAEPLISAEYLDLATQLAHRQTEPVGRILANFLPAALRSTQIRLRAFHGEAPKEMSLTALKTLAEEELRGLGELWRQRRVEPCRKGQSPLDAELCLLAADPPWPVRPAAKAQAALLDHLHERGAVTRRALVNALGKTASATLATLTRRGLVHIRPAEGSGGGEEEPAGPPIAPAVTECANGFTLTRQQQQVYESLLQAAQSGSAQTRLLFGITGSGKTAVYLALAEAVLASGRSVLLLAPEVALALKLRADVKAALPESCLPADRRMLYHGYMSAGAKERAFLATAKAGSDAPFLVVGTRSALLLPLGNVGLIVLDEEHDSSFKQDEGFTYQAKEVAWYRAKTQNALLLLGSATPDVKSFYSARQGLIPMHVLRERVGGGSLPEVRLVPLRKGGGAKAAQGALLAPESLDALQQVVERGEQAVILLNRRGYAPLMYCLACNAVARCPHCDIGLAYHKGRERLLCHYCGYSVPYPSPCAACGGMRFLPMGEGTEKLEEVLAGQLPPGTGLLRLDRDSTRRPGRMEEILAAFARKEASVLVGTQMLSKGHHFPDVTLAIVADADLGLNLPDYRAAERTFQLLVQSAGRAGRGSKAGRVLIQTREPEHYCWEYVRNADYEGFFERELALRERRRYPPFVRLALIRISHDMEDAKGPSAVNDLGVFLREKAPALGVAVLGPAPAPLPLLKGRRRWHCLLKSDDWQPLRALYAQALGMASGGALRLRLDLDPVNML